MAEGSYRNFDLVLERSGEKFRARVFDSPAGQASAQFDVPFSELELENFVLRMGRPRKDARRLDSLEMDAVRKCGDRLFRAVLTDDVYACFLRSRDAALEEGKGLRVRLRIDVPEFHDYPWELLYNAHLNQFLALSKETPVVRYLELPYPVQPLKVQPPLKILVMISSPQGFPQLNVEEEWRRLSNALAPLIRRSLVNLERLKHPTLSALQQQLRRDEYHIFHFIGHGKYSEHRQEGMLLLEDEAGQGRPVSGEYLGAVLHDHRSLRLVVLNACEGARTSREDPYAGVAQTLVVQGIPAVIAMQFEIFETAAITFAQEFYGAMVDGFPVDAAVSEARKAIFATGNDVEWGTPVLYMRTPQGVIFEIPQAERAGPAIMEGMIPYVDKELEQRLEQLYTEGLAAFWVQDWDKACDRFQRILDDRPGHAAAAAKLEEAKRKRRLSVLYAGAVDAQKAEDWTAALKTLEELLKEASDYKDAGAMREAVKKQKQLAELYAEAKQLHAAKKWQAVAEVFAQVKSIDPDYPDTENLLPTAEKELEELKRQAELNELYSRAVHAMDTGRWEEARRLLVLVQEKEPAFLETERLLPIVEAEIRQLEEEQQRRNQISTLYEQAHGLLRTGQWRKALDKIQEIRRLDELFEDPEKLAEQAQSELAREEKEAEHQNELAAMYAEAVRLLRAEKYREALEKWQEIKTLDAGYPDRQLVELTARKSLAVQEESARQEQEARRQKQLAAMYAEAVQLVRTEKYQQALEKWQEIRSIDPRYPDRQLVERTARKNLAALAKPAPARRRIAVPRSLWIGLGGVAVMIVIVLWVLPLPTPAGGIDCRGAKSGDEISLIYPEGDERLSQIAQPLVDACGIVFKPESARDQAVLDARVQAGTPPDVVFWHNVILQQYRDKLFAMDRLGARRDVYVPGTVDPGVVGGKWLGLPVSSYVKSTIWYSPAYFEELGYRIPTTWQELDALVERMVAHGQVPWAMALESGEATGWTGSDFIQDILLVQQGPEYVQGLITGSIPYNDPGVRQAYETYGRWARDPKYAFGGAEGTLSRPYLDAIFMPFFDPPEAMMVRQAFFAGGTIENQFPHFQYGTDYDFFVVPGAKGLQVGSDWMMAFSDKPAVKALVSYLASPEGGANWAKAGFGLSPNKGARGNFTYPDLVKIAGAFYTTGGLTPDLGDTIGGNFTIAEWRAIVAYLNGENLDAVLADAAAAQAQALK